jgi:magnesium chelatase family protein
LLDWTDIHIEVPRVDYEKLSGDRMGESSESIRARVQAARNIQLECFSKIDSSNIVVNADMRVGGCKAILQVTGRRSESDAGGDESSQFIGASLCTAQCHRILKLARMIADLAGSEEIQSPHLAEALQYRPKIMMGQEKYCL